MREIRKYALLQGLTVFMASASANVLLVGFDPKLSTPCIWFEGDWVDEPQVARHFSILGTGWAIAPDLSHVGSLIEPDGCVWHVYERDSSHG